MLGGGLLGGALLGGALADSQNDAYMDASLGVPFLRATCRSLTRALTCRAIKTVRTATWVAAIWAIWAAATSRPLARRPAQEVEEEKGRPRNDLSILTL